MLQCKRNLFYSMTHQQREDDRTYSSLGALECIQLRLRQSLQLCASSERDPYGNFVANQTHRYYQVWTHPVLNHYVFKHPLFFDLVQAMAIEESNHSNKRVIVPPAISNKIDHSIDRLVSPLMQDISNQVTSTHSTIKKIAEEVDTLKHLFYSKNVNCDTGQSAKCLAFIFAHP